MSATAWRLHTQDLGVMLPPAMRLPCTLSVGVCVSRYAMHFLVANGAGALTAALALARPPFCVVRYALAALEAVTRACGPAACEVLLCFPAAIFFVSITGPFLMILCAAVSDQESAVAGMRTAQHPEAVGMPD